MRNVLILCVITLFPLGKALADELTQTPNGQHLAWDQYWLQVKDSNYSLKALEARKRSVESEIVQELPAPTFSASSMGEKGPFSGTMETTLGVSQKIPFPTKFIQAAQVKSAREELAQSEENLGTQKIKEKASESFIGLYGVLRQKELLNEKRVIFDRHLKTLRSLTLSSQIQQMHLLEIESELKLISNELKELSIEENKFRLELASFLGEDKPVLFEPDLPKNPREPGSIQPSPHNRIERQVAQKMEELQASERGLARQAWMPDLIFSFTNRNRLDGVMPKSQEFMVGIELPFLWAWQPARQNQRATALFDKSHFEALQTEKDTLTQAEEEQKKLNLLWEAWVTLRDEILPLTEKRVHLLHRITPSDMETLDLHKNTLTQFVDLRVKALKVETDYRKLESQLSIREEFSK